MTSSGSLVVVGDSLLDIDVDGTADRLCPDAPVPVVDLARRWIRPGGAALAALVASRAVDEVVLVTAVGVDDAAADLVGLLDGHVGLHRLTLDGDTACKTRVRARGVPMLRLDWGSGRADGAGIEDDVAAALLTAGAILVSDYGRGVSANPWIRRLLQQRAGEIPVVWDPHPKGAAPIPHCTLITPNAAEARAAAGTDQPAKQAAQLTRRWQAAAVAVTLGERGAVLCQADSGRSISVPVVDTSHPAATNRPDTCGAGDAFAAAAATSLLAGADLETAVPNAVRSASDFVYAGGASALSTLTGVEPPASSPAASDVFALADRIRRSGGRLVATGGCFDLLHRGHISLLSQARALGDALVVCLNSDDSVRRAKGPHRPVVGQDDRARVLEALRWVDGVQIFDEDTPRELLARLRPDIWVKGADYTGRPLPERDTVERLGGRVVLLPVVPGYSTTRLVSASRAAAATALPQEAR
jgi:rfaE bifunctional protein nucleotidyltransferase chain/domain/rfaE bifunctional protein kinase chain/domain